MNGKICRKELEGYLITQQKNKYLCLIKHLFRYGSYFIFYILTTKTTATCAIELAKLTRANFNSTNFFFFAHPTLKMRCP